MAYNYTQIEQLSVKDYTLGSGVMRWRDINIEKPEPDQYCLVKYKHGYISGQYVGPDQEDLGRDSIFRTYIWEDKEYYGDLWMPVEEFEKVAGHKHECFNWGVG